MALQTCFLPHFPRTLLGRSKTSESSRVARGLRQLRDLALPDLAALLGGLLPADFFLNAPDAQAKRERIYPPVTLFWAFLFQVLNPAMPCQEVVGKVRAWFISRRNDTKRPALSTAAYCEARSALSSRLLQTVFDALRMHLDRRAAATWLWCGRSVKVLDGTSFSMPDTAANQRQWPQPSGQKKGCGFPVAKMLGVFCLSTGGWIGHALSKWRCHDLSLWHRLSHLLVKNDVLVGDAGFCAYALMAELKARGVDVVFRLHQKRSKDMRRGQKLGKDDRLQTWNKPAKRPEGSPWKKRAWNKLPAQLEVRIVRVSIKKRLSHPLPMDRHHVERRQVISSRQASRAVLSALEHRAVLPRRKNHHAHGSAAHQKPRDDRERATDARHRLQCHPCHHPAKCHRASARARAHQLQRRGGPAAAVAAAGRRLP